MWIRVRPWTNQYSMESNRRTIRTSRPLSSRTSRIAVSSVVSPGVGRALGEGPGDPVALALPLADDQLRLALDEPDDDATRRGGDGLLQAGHAGATEERRGPPARVSLVHSIADAGAGRPLRTGRAGAIVRARHGARTRGQRPDVRPAQHGPVGGGRGERGRGTEPELPLPGPGRRVDEPCRPGRVTCGNAVLHVRIVPRQGSGASAVRSRSAASGDRAPRRSAMATSRASSAR